MVTVAFAGLLAGVFVGIVVTSIEFIFFYSRINTIKYTGTLQSYRSNVIRPLEEQELLKKHGALVQLFKLQGYVFFASAKRLVDTFTEIINFHDKKALILDFQLVNGMDLSATISLLGLVKAMDQAQIQLLFTGCSPAIMAQFLQQNSAQDSGIGFFPDLDLGLETSENHLLSLYKGNLSSPQEPLAHMLSALSPNNGFF